MRRKYVAGLLAAAMSLTLLAGCGGGDAQNNTPSTQQSDAKANGGEQAGGEVQTIIMTYLTTGQTPADLQKVQDAVNDISRELIGVEVQLKDVAIPDTFSNYSLWIGSGEQIDLMCVAFQGLNNYVNSGQLLPIDDLLASDGAYISELAKEYPMTDGAVVQGSTYGVLPVLPCYGFRGGLIVREDYFNETGVQMKDQFTWEEATEVLEKIKEAHPETYPVAALGSGVGSTATDYGFFAEMDNLGATSASGSLLSADSTTIENVYATEGYKQFILMMRDWYEKGLILPDAATTDSTGAELMASGKTCVNPMNTQPIQSAGTEASYGWTSVVMNLTDGYYPSMTAAGGTYWAIPITSANPNAAMKFLNLMYEDQRIADLLKSGIEGEHYVKTDTDYVVAYPDGVTPENTTFSQPLGLFGDRRYELSFSEGASIEVNEAWTEKNLAKPYQSVGYNYDTSAMTNQIIAVNTVLDQYLPSLETGSVANVEEVYGQFLSALEAAGINDIIADNQAQFDAWRAEQ